MPAFPNVAQALDQRANYDDIAGAPWYPEARYERFDDQEYYNRYTKLRARMAERQIDAVIAPGTGNNWGFGAALVWLTGLRLREAALAQYIVVPRTAAPTLVTAYTGAHLEAVRRHVFVQDVRPAPEGDFGQALAGRLLELNLGQGHIGLLEAAPDRNDDVMPANHLATLRRLLPQATFEPLRGWFHEMVHVKSDAEIAAIERAGRLLDDAFAAMVAAARPGITEAELTAVAARAMIDGGGTPGLLIVGATASSNPALPFGNTRPSLRRLEAGDVVVNELSASILGFSAQFGQPICVGEPAPAVRRFWDGVVQPGFERLASLMRPGVRLEQVQEAGHWYERHGATGRPLLLHGMDLTTARPRVGIERIVAYDYERTLKPGMTVMLEPDAITGDGCLGLFVGRTYVISETGGHAVSQTPVELVVTGA